MLWPLPMGAASSSHACAARSARAPRLQDGLPAISYERTPGAALRPAPRPYRRREPEKTALYAVVREHLETMLDEARRGSDSGDGYPVFIEREFVHYLHCGLLSRGFARLRCPSCGFERLVAFSCKGRICPSCWARRAADTAARLVDRVLPPAPYRQWVLTFPFEARFLLAVDGEFLTEMLSAFMRTLFAWMRLRARRIGVARGEPGSVTFVQRFGGALNLNPHLHSIVTDGVFAQGPDGHATFVPLPPPDDEDVRALAQRLAKRLGAIARRRFADSERQERDPDRAALRVCAAEALRLPLRRDGLDDPDAKPLCARVDGFSLHAARTVAPHDRDALERLCRYGLRPPLSLDRLSLDTDGRVRLRLLRPWPTPDGRSDIVLDPVPFLRRIAALIPAPYANLVRYHGAFANRSRLRPLLPTPASRTTATPPLNTAQPHHASGQVSDDESLRRPRHLGWAALLRRVLDVDALACPKCNVPMVVLAFITDPHVVKRILDHLHLPSVPPPVAPARLRLDDNPSLALSCDEYRDDWGPGSCDGIDEPPRAPRAPP